MTELSYFEQLYRDDPDPWRLDSAPYEHRKRALTLASLPQEDAYRRGFEPACARGRLTALLADRCDALVAMDPVEEAVEAVRALQLPGVRVTQGALPHDWPSGPLDLVVFSEILYFLDAEGRREAVDRAVRALTPGGHLLSVHWRHDFKESASAPEQAHADLHRAGLRRLVLHEERDFRLEVHERV